MSISYNTFHATSNSLKLSDDISNFQKDVQVEIRNISHWELFDVLAQFLATLGCLFMYHFKILPFLHAEAP